MPRIFISYRRSDSKDISGRIRDRLKEAFGNRRIFLDVNDIPAGEDFEQKFLKELSASDIVLVIIGQTWADATNQARLNDANDYVRIEVETALRTGKRVIPVLVNGAEMPSIAKLPSTLARLPARNAPTINTASFDRDMDHLINQIGVGRPRRLMLAVAAILVLIAAIFLVTQGALSTPSTPTETLQATVASETPTDQPTNTPAPTSTPTERPTETPMPLSETPTATHTVVPPSETPTNTPSPSATDTTQPSATQKPHPTDTQTSTSISDILSVQSPTPNKRCVTITTDTRHSIPVRYEPNGRFNTNQPEVQHGENVTVVEEDSGTSGVWYRIQYSIGQIYEGWIEAHQTEASACR